MGKQLQKRSETETQPQTIEQWLSAPQFQEAIAKALPKHMHGDRFARVALTAFKKDTKLAQCEPGTFLAAVLTAASMGLEIGVGGECWLVPFKKDCQLMLGYRGLIKLAYQTGEVVSIRARAVRLEDKFDVVLGSEERYTHVPMKQEPPKNASELRCVYAIVELKGGGTPLSRLMWAEDVEKVRKAAPSANSPAWQNWYEEMALAKVLKRTLKHGPQTFALAQAIDLDDAADVGKPQAFDAEFSHVPMPEPQAMEPAIEVPAKSSATEMPEKPKEEEKPEPEPVEAKAEPTEPKPHPALKF